MSGAVWHHKVARFRVIPYFARRRIEIPEGIMKIIDTDEAGLEKIRNLPDEDAYPDRNYLMDDVKLVDSDESDQEERDKTDDIYEQEQ